MNERMEPIYYGQKLQLNKKKKENFEPKKNVSSTGEQWKVLKHSHLLNPPSLFLGTYENYTEQYAVATHLNLLKQFIFI